MNILIKLYQSTSLSQLVSKLKERMFGWSPDIQSLVYKEADNTEYGITKIIPSLIGNGTNTIVHIPSHGYSKYKAIRLTNSGVYTSAISNVSATEDATHFVFDVDADNIYITKNGIWTMDGLSQGNVYLSSISANTLTNTYTGIEQFIGIYDGSKIHLDFDNNVYRRTPQTSGYVFFDGIKYNTNLINDLATSGGTMTSGASIYFGNTYINSSGLYLYSESTSAYSTIDNNHIEYSGNISTSGDISGTCFYEDDLALSAKYLTSGSFDDIFATKAELSNYVQVSATSAFALESQLSNYISLSGDVGFYGITPISRQSLSGTIYDKTLNDLVTTLSNVGLIDNQTTLIDDSKYVDVSASFIVDSNTNSNLNVISNLTITLNEDYLNKKLNIASVVSYDVNISSGIVVYYNGISYTNETITIPSGYHIKYEQVNSSIWFATGLATLS